ncbi:transcription elongation factor GreA [Spirochaetia bacterium]|nr:transcription elongation factor GreA [Spirochaetia bacterium]
MSEVLLKNVQEMLNEEKWTRATLSNYSTDQFKKLDVVLKEALEEKASDELKALCDEHLSRTKNSIIGLYFSGIIALSKQIIDDGAMINLVSIFIDNHKWNVVKYLCERILDYGESKYALRTLCEGYKNEGEEGDVFSIWERLVKVDYEEADLAKAIAVHYEDAGELETSIDYYKKALNRYINKSLFINVKEIWEKLVEFCPEDIDFFLHEQRKIAKKISEDKAVSLLMEVYDSCKARDDINTAISILKIMLDYDSKDANARREITDCFRKKYAAHSQLEEYIRMSNLASGHHDYRDVHEAIADFEKHIAFDKGSYVFHRTWGVGRIASMTGDDIVIDFAKKRNHSMSLKMAVNALQTLPKEHIWVLKATWKPDKLKEKIKGDYVWILKIMIKSFENTCDIKRIKAELVPGVLTPGEWTTWSTNARKILKEDTSFGVSPDNIDLYTVRDRPVTIDEKLYNEFKAERNFFDRVATLRNFVSQKDVEPDSEYLKEMIDYFKAYLRTNSQINEMVAASYLLIKDLLAQFPSVTGPLALNFLDIFEQIEDIPEIFRAIKDIKLREDFLHHIKLFVSDWANIYVKLFPYALLPSIIDNLIKEGHEDKLYTLVLNCFENFRDNKEAVVWLFKNSSETEWFKKAAIPFDKQLITLIHILDISYREIENHRDTSENRKINKQVYNILFKENLLGTYIDKADEDTIIWIYTFINDVKDLDPQDKMTLRSRILDKRADFKFFGDSDRPQMVSSNVLLVTAAMYGAKQRELEQLTKVDMPANSAEIAYALSLGDLRENAEYKAGKEKQEQLNTMAKRLKEEIDRAQLFDPKSLNLKRVSFGTKVKLKNSSSGETDEYTILGPWESNPNNHIISYLSPLGAAMLNKSAGDDFVFSIGTDRVSYQIEEITAAVL